MSKKSLTKASHFLSAIFALSALAMAGLIDGEPCSIWLHLAVFVIAVISYVGCMALSDMAERG